ncbi:MAG: Daunorubicin/doxorubicin resistance ATP-binding protein DrrA [Verrucomicrobiota bacterium]
MDAASSTDHAAAVVSLDEVVKTFRGHRAVDGFSLTVPEGSLFGFIGPNGSGKTTTLRMILRIVEPDSGQIRVFGKAISATANNAIGYLPEERGLYRKMTVLRQLIYFGTLKGLRSGEARRRAMDWLERMGLAEWRDRKLETLSKGMSQKIQFISTVLSGPRLLILDEPFSGLDPVNLEGLREALLQLRRSGTTVIFSTHDMHTAETLCDQICMIYKGRKVLDGSLESIQNTYGADTVRMRFRDQFDLQSASVEGMGAVRHLGRFWEARCADEPWRLLPRLARLGQLEHFEVIHPSLQDIFVRIARPEQELTSLKGSGDA